MNAKVEIDRRLTALLGGALYLVMSAYSCMIRSSRLHGLRYCSHEMRVS
jgi:hypothetical protein